MIDTPTAHRPIPDCGSFFYFTQPMFSNNLSRVLSSLNEPNTRYTWSLMNRPWTQMRLLSSASISPSMKAPDASWSFLNKNLNQEQKDAAFFALSALDLAIVHDSPGTGKAKPSDRKQSKLNLGSYRLPFSITAEYQTNKIH